MKENVPVAQAATTSKELPPRVQEALGELVGVAQVGQRLLQALPLPRQQRHQLDFFACSGAVTTDLWRDTKFGEFPQLEREEVNPATELVTLTIGGNDVEFSTILKECILSIDCTTYPFAARMLNGDFRSTESYASDLLNELPNKLATTYSKMKGKIGPNDGIGTDTVVVVLGYPRLFGAQGTANQLACTAGDGQGFSPPEQNFLSTAADGVRDRTSQQAANAGFHFKDVIPDFAGHELCGDSSDWLNPLLIDTGGIPSVAPGSFHPNLTGQAAYRDILSGYISMRRAEGGPLESSGLPANGGALGAPDPTETTH